MGAKELAKQSKTYKRIREHRKNCKKWGKDFCIKCFGDGLIKFVEDVDEEVKLERKKKRNG